MADPTVITIATAIGTGIGFGVKLLHSKLAKLNGNGNAVKFCSSHELLVQTYDRLVTTTDQTARVVQEINERLAGWKGQVDTRIDFLERGHDRLDRKLNRSKKEDL